MLRTFEKKLQGPKGRLEKTAYFGELQFTLLAEVIK
jgi:hypothetical protein